MRVRGILLILPLLPAALLAQQSASQSATVINAGKWLYQGKILRRGQMIPTGPAAKEEITAGPGAGDLLLDCPPPKEPRKYTCNDKDCHFVACSEPVPRVVVASPLPLWASSSLLRSFLLREPQEIVTLGVRGGGNPVDALLLMDARGVHWGPALARVLEGRYCLRLTPLPSGAARVVTIDWDRATDAEGVAPAAGTAAGIYSLDKGTPGAAGACSVESDARAAWVVIAPEAQFNGMNSGWKQRSAELTQMERSDAGPDVAATLRHAVLASMAASAASK